MKTLPRNTLLYNPCLGSLVLRNLGEYREPDMGNLAWLWNLFHNQREIVWGSFGLEHHFGTCALQPHLRTLRDLRESLGWKWLGNLTWKPCFEMGSGLWAPPIQTRTLVSSKDAQICATSHQRIFTKTVSIKIPKPTISTYLNETTIKIKTVHRGLMPKA